MILDNFTFERIWILGYFNIDKDYLVLVQKNIFSRVNVMLRVTITVG